MTPETNRRELISVVVGGAIGYVATHYLTGANPLIGLLIGGFTPLLVAIIRGDDPRLWKALWARKTTKKR